MVKIRDEVKLILPGTDMGWELWGKTVPFDETQIIRITSPEQVNTSLGRINNFPGILVLPLFVREGKNIEPFGLNIIKCLRLENGNYDCTPLFVVPSERDIPPVNIDSDFVSTFAKEIINSKEFGDDLNAVFLAELIKNQIKTEHQNKDKDPQAYNIAILNENKDIKKILSVLSEYVNEEKRLHLLREFYYSTFIKYYNSLGEIRDGKFLINLESFLEKWKDTSTGAKKLFKEFENTKLGAEELYEIPKIANNILNNLNGIEPEGPHHVSLEVFRAPIPFPLKELLEAKSYLRELLGKNKKKIKLLLIDNKIDKVYAGKNGRKTLGDLVDEFSEINDFFELRMLGEANWTSLSGSMDEFNDESNTFNCREFLKQIKQYKNGNPKLKDIENFDYLKNIYSRIKEAHFILLDFFLNTDNTYRAFDFIRDIMFIKSKEGDASTSWFFITSAVYDSVVKYSQSGLLAEYYESAVVNSGDDPTNEKRQIIFIYKLLTFIKARISAFNSYKTSIENKLIVDRTVRDRTGEQVFCEDYASSDLICPQKDDCLKDLQTHIKRYLTEFNDVASIIYEEKHIDEIREVIQSLDNLINQFIWSPEGNWYIIQLQIDFINERLRKIDNENIKKLKFSCGYIINEINERSEAY